MNNSQLLIIGHVWPEPNSTAAGSRMLQLIELFIEEKFSVVFASAAQKTTHSFDLTQLGVNEASIQLNDHSFQEFVKDVAPSFVIYDRFLTEEQFGWRVREACPESVQILDTEDLHFLRKAREQAFKKEGNLSQVDLYSIDAKREIGAMMRCDLNLIISSVEYKLLLNKFQFSEEQLFYLPFLINIENKKSNPSFNERKNVVSIGNFLHAPNWDQVLYLKTSIWPLVRKRNKEIELHIYGAYSSEKVLQLHQPKEGFLVKGRAKDAQKCIQNYRLLLAPLRFGAGLKGKIMDAFSTKTPVITSSIGAEGMQNESEWPGSISDDPNEFAKHLLDVYSNESEWNLASKRTKKLLVENFSKKDYAKYFVERISSLQSNLSEHRKRFFMGQVLQHQLVNAQKFMSLWIEAKTKMMK